LSCAVLVAAGVVTVGSTSPALADPGRVGITMSASSNPVAAGSQLTYTIDVQNTPGASIEDVALTDQVEGLTGLILTSNVGTCSQSDHLVTCEAGSLEGFQSWRVTIRGVVTAANGTTLHNTATATGTQSSQTFTEAASTSVLVTSGSSAPLPDLTLSMTGPAQAADNSAVDYKVTVGNIGGVQAREITLLNTLPAGFSYVPSSIVGSSLFSCAIDLSDPLVLACTGGAVNDGATATIQFRATSASGVDVGPHKDTAVVDPYDEIAEVNEENNTASHLSGEPAPPAQQGFSITKADSPDPLRPGNLLTYTIVATNISTTRADSVTVTDGTTGLDAASVSATSTLGTCTVAAAKVTCTRKSPVLRLEPGESMTVTVKGTIVNTASSLITNTATITGNIKNKGYTSTAATTTSVRPGVDLTVVQHSVVTHSEAGAPDRFRAWDTYKYVITVGNSGLDAASNVVVREPLPAGAQFKSAVAPAGTTCVEAPPGSAVVRCTGLNLNGFSAGQPWGDTETITLFVIAPPTTGTVQATVTVDPGNAIFESDEANNTATTTTVIDTGIDLSVMKSTDPKVATSGTLVYTILVTNNGTQDATGVSFRDTLPAGTRFRSAEEVFELPVPPGTPDHRFSCSHNGSSTGGTVECTGGQLRGTHDHVLVPDVSTLQITLFAPAAPGFIKNVVRVDPDSAIPEIFEDNNVNTFRNEIRVWDPTDPTDTTCCAFHELTIDKTQVFPAGNVAPSGVLDYDITVKNVGSDIAFGVNVVDHMPAGSVFRSAQDSAPGQGAFACTNSGTVITCVGGTLDGTVNQAPGPDTRTIHVRLFAPTQPGSYTNQAVVDPGNAVPEANETNNSDNVDTTVILGGGGDYIDLKVDSKQTAPLDGGGSPDEVVPHGTLQYELDVTNVGTAVAFNVTVRDVIPNGSTFRNAFDKNPGAGAFDCSESGGVVTCTGGTVAGNTNATPDPSDQTRTIVINLFAPNQPGSGYVNQAFVDPANVIPENSEINNSDLTNLTVALNGGGNYTDLKVDTITPDKATPQPGEAYKYTVVVKNTGTDVAYDVSLRNILDSGVTYVKTTATNDFFCTEAAHVVTCTGGVLDGTPVGQDPDHTDTATIEIFVKAPLVHGYVAPIQSRIDPDNAIPESNEGNNSKTASITVTSLIDLQVDVGSSTASTGAEGDWTFTTKNTGSATAQNVTVVFDIAVGIIPLNVQAPPGWSCQITENPINEVTCVGDQDTSDDTFTVHVYKTADETIHSTATIDPANTVVETNEDNNSDQGTG
jgi:uncharacterized repeat protein (TIGR01451 family)